MLGVIIFDATNDVVYSHTSEGFNANAKDLAAKQNVSFFEDRNIFRSSGSLTTQNEELDKNIIVHLFSPLVTSHRVMNNQFRNEYENITCEDGTVICFHQLSSFLLLAIGKDSLSFLTRYIQMCAKFVTSLVGKSVLLLRSQSTKKQMLDRLLITWRRLYQKEQCYIVEAVERVVTDENMSPITFKSLSAASAEVCKCSSITACHALLLEGSRRLLALYSSENAADLSGGDILFLNILVESLRNGGKLNTEGGTLLKAGLLEVQLPSRKTHFSPHLFSFHEIAPSVVLVILAETNRSNLSASLLKLANIFEGRKREVFSDLDKIDECMEACSAEGQKMGEDISTKIRMALRRVKRWWEFAKGNGILHWTKSSDQELPSRLEVTLKSAFDEVINTWESICTDVSHLMPPEVVDNAVEAFRTQSAGCSFQQSVNMPVLTPKKYMEDFPGLVHFVYVDRYLNQMTSPCLNRTDPTSPPENPQSLTDSLAMSSFRSMVSFARDHLAKGHLSLLWKDKTFSYGYFLWFEDSAGNPIKPDTLNDTTLKELPLPGILVKDFYREFVAKVFPTQDPQRLRVYELYCIHLGLATSLCILEQTRRLAATVWELSGPSAINPIDLL